MLRDIIVNYNKIVIVGNGNVGMAVYWELLTIEKDLEIAFCDNNCSRIGRYDTYDVYSFEDAVKKYPDAIYLVASVNHIKKMEKQLISLGVHKEKIHSADVYTYFLELHDKYILQRKTNPQEYLRMEVSLAEHCNLNCKYCAHFSSIAEKEFLDISVYEKDIFRMSELLDAKSGIIYLLGGEPLLYPDINKCMQLTREAFPKSRIIVLTNGLLINKMDKVFFEMCRQLQIVVCVTKYPIKFDYEKVVARLETEGIEFDYMRMSDEDCCFSKYTFDLLGRQDPYNSFTRCGMANQCHLLKKGKIYTCSVIGCSEHFCKKFNVSMELTDNDSIDIYKVNDKEELLEKLAKPADFCRFCDVDNRIDNLPFEISKREISEWV